MRVLRRSFIVGMLVFTMILPGFDLHAGKIIVRENDENRLEILSADFAGIQARNILSVVDLRNVQTEAGEFVFLKSHGYTKSLMIGHPRLPVKRELIEIPSGAEPEVVYYEISYTDYKLGELGFNAPLFPLQPEHIKSQDYHEFVIDDAAYEANEFTGEELVSIDNLGYMRGTGIGRVNIAAVQYNPVLNTIRVFDEIRFGINFKHADIPATIEKKQRYYSPFFTAIQKQLINYQSFASRENFMRYPVKYVIVSDPLFENQLQPFIEWKTKKGFTVIEAYTDDPDVGNTTTSIQSYLQSLYDEGTTEDPAPSFVLFVGDVDQVPVFYGNTGSHVTDLPYCEYTGDYFPEVYYGRFSAEDSADLQPQIDKTLQYEKYEMPDPSYLNEVVLVAGMDGTHGYDWGNGQINYGTTNYFNDTHGITSQTYLYPESGNHSADIIQDVSDGLSYGNYTAHCGPGGWSSPSFTISDVSTLENEDMYGLLVGNCCQSNSFGVDECFGEALLRAENKGALGYIGGSNNTMWDPDYYWGVGVGQISENPPPYEETTLGAYDRMFHDHGEDFGEWYVTQDEMIYAGNLAVTEGTPASAEYYWEVYHLMGDPSLMVYFSEPPPMMATYQDFIFIGVDTFQISAEPYAYVGLSMNGALHGAGLADSLGNISLDIEPFTNPGEAELVITGQNRAPLMDSINVIPPDGPYLIFNDKEINDASGNNNQQADYGESIVLDVWLENVGKDDADEVSAMLSTSDTMVSITDDFGEWGLIAAHDTSLLENAFGIDIHENIIDQHIVLFDLLMESGDKEQWSGSFTMILQAPELKLADFTINDTANGNGNGRLDPGETADLIFETSNTGHALITEVTAELNCSHEEVVLHNNLIGIDSLQAAETYNAIYTVSTPEEMEAGTSLTFEYNAFSGYYELFEEIISPVGLILEDWESGDFNNYEWSFGGNEFWQICEEDAYEGDYCSQSGDIFDSQSTSMYVEYNVAMDDSISFYRKVSCEDDPYEDNYDYLAFYIDDLEMGRWDGIQAWERVSFPVETGLHTFKWTYQKDYSVSAGDDCAWVDYIVFPPEPPTVGKNETSGKEISWNIYPNPGSHKLNFSLKAGKGNVASIYLYNELGRLQAKVLEDYIITDSNMNFEFNASGLPVGIYHCELIIDQIKYIRKIIIVH